MVTKIEWLVIDERLASTYVFLVELLIYHTCIGLLKNDPINMRVSQEIVSWDISLTICETYTCEKCLIKLAHKIIFLQLGDNLY